MQTECHPSYAGKNLSSAYMCWAYTWRIRKINNLRYLFGLLDFDRCEGKPGKFPQTFSHFAASNYPPFIILVLRPPDGVFIHILPNAEIIRLVADHMVVIAPLPNGKTGFFVCKPFPCGEKRRQSRVRRGRRPRRPALPTNGKNEMHMVGHDDIMIDGYLIIKGVHFQQSVPNHCTTFR